THTLSLHDALPISDAVARIDRRLPIGGLGAEISAPCLVAGAGRLRQLLAMPVGALQPAEIGALADAVAGHEKAHAGLLRLAGAADDQHQQRACCPDPTRRLHRPLPSILVRPAAFRSS